MTTTYAVPFAATGEDKTLELTTIDRANFGAPLNTTVKNGGRESVYGYVDGNPSRPTSLRVGHYPPSAQGATVNESVKLRTVGVKTDGDGVETDFPFEATLAVADGSLGQLARADVAAMLMMLVSVYLEPAGVDDEASTTVLTRMSFGETEILNVTFA